MRIFLHIGPEAAGANRLQDILNTKREQLKSKGILFPRSPGGRNHTRLFMAITDSDHVDPLRFNRGFAASDKQYDLLADVEQGLTREIEQHSPGTLILSAAQLSTSLYRPSEITRLHQLLSKFSQDITVVAFIDDPARLMMTHYGDQVIEGRATPLDQELELCTAPNWWQAAIDTMPAIDPMAGVFEETQGPAFWLDFPALQRTWENVFGTGSLRFLRYDQDLFGSREAVDAITRAFEIPFNIGRAEEATPEVPPSAASLARGRQFNEMLLRFLKLKNKHVPRQLWRGLQAELQINSPSPDPTMLGALSKRFEAANSALMLDHQMLDEDIVPNGPAQPWVEADPDRGFRASQYLLSALFRIQKATKEKGEERRAELSEHLIAPVVKSASSPLPQHTAETVAPTPIKPAPAPVSEPFERLTASARASMPPQALPNLEKLKTSSFAPHNRLGAVDEEQLAAAYTPIAPRDLPKNNSGNVIVGCMKNEAPYITEWVAYHRAMGVDNFLIYTNDCSDGTTEILDRLQDLGVLQHRNNDEWKGNSPQQYALNQALKEPVIKNAEWIIHIDVDEFINVRTGNGTLQDFLAEVPDATNVAMTWRLFGHNGVTHLSDELVIDQFDTCAPKFCPKPHTVWGFKTMFKNIGAYEKISCHRPNKLDDAHRAQVQWVNGSGKDMTKEAADKGWRSSKKSIGYDLIQLNHYALRSAESYLIKRQRGRALHVDRSIGLNYWIRMDWSDFRDVTIKRNLPRLRAEYDRLMQDDTLRAWHQKGLEWHLAKAKELHKNPEFEDLYQQALTLKMTETERVAYALALDLET
ncbi:glycosyltransferase family 2 protein [Phaeobacter gallaeciensis]|uniref:Glycosyltransferase family 2 protein n=2 Tax=Roseobacteraceae TaxID=2854170 RepID=A0A366WTK7_9RHOB|nr:MULTISPECIES: glycosyltransferase family 2 protein [Roseobacteraceae]MBT3140901.1 glycosyltransferase family 2 protein [Falsiruegeria litorea]MBT8170645.1 glycosyltransferase family 2 protein [Falsiruegeria litorea]RBW52846.1 glycosyltransferase family 2 protein [Phaeobacter gallaeciensis]